MDYQAFESVQGRDRIYLEYFILILYILSTDDNFDYKITRVTRVNENNLYAYRDKSDKYSSLKTI